MLAALGEPQPVSTAIKPANKVILSAAKDLASKLDARCFAALNMTWGDRRFGEPCAYSFSSPLSSSSRLAVNIRSGADGEPNLQWEWSDDIAWEPTVRMAMSSETANRYFQGKENVAIAIARRRIKAGGDVKAALAIIPLTKPLFILYRDMIAADYPHLEV